MKPDHHMTSHPRDQMQGAAQGEIRHNSLRSAFGTYSVFPLRYPLHLKGSGYRVCYR